MRHDGKKYRILNVTAGGAYGYHWALNSFAKS
jgi:hypothetical protein